MGGAAAIISNRADLGRHAKYALEQCVRVHTGQEDDAYRTISWGPDSKGINGVYLGKDVPVQVRGVVVVLCVLCVVCCVLCVCVCLWGGWVCCASPTACALSLSPPSPPLRRALFCPHPPNTTPTHNPTRPASCSRRSSAP